MKTNDHLRNVTIISEIHPQHYGSMNEIKRMIIQSKIGGADIVKVQLYDSKKLWGHNRREAGWNAGYINGQIIKKIGPILNTLNFNEYAKLN